uniref:Fructose-1,6-bisphosphatase, cytosolic n=1 Tax=Odontella aurita TaxID=265563 RepID=A0A7S4N4E6_9STRA|mmetsp:Transcript_4732/g.13333  ORF Transcript_4732/g.13333 Transcript_4732/m.13333 type:complete len:316 (+) Transcript_4732:171-1118(+)
MEGEHNLLRMNNFVPKECPCDYLFTLFGVVSEGCVARLFITLSLELYHISCLTPFFFAWMHLLYPSPCALTSFPKKNDSAFSVGDYVAVFDPLDGSKNIDASLPVGTIFGIYKKEAFQDEVTPETFLQRGSDSLVAAGYCLYSATTVLVLTLGSGVDGFTLDPDKSSFLHTHEDIRIPPSGPIYSFNEANFHDFSYPVRRYLNALKEGSSSVGKRSNARYVGALVADVHNVLINGGIYGYPSTRANANGKLRLLYESNPMAMIVEQAGGAASTGNAGRILDVKPTDIHQRVPTFLGSVENVFELDQFHTYYEDEE